MCQLPSNKNCCTAQLAKVAPWRSGYAELCKSSYTGSIPVGASNFIY